MLIHEIPHIIQVVMRYLIAYQVRSASSVLLEFVRGILCFTGVQIDPELLLGLILGSEKWTS